MKKCKRNNVTTRWSSALLAGTLFMGLAVPPGYGSPAEENLTQGASVESAQSEAVTVQDATYSPDPQDDTDTRPQSPFPELLITEVVPDTANLSGSDAYEFIEIYNNSDQELNWRNYKLLYQSDEWDTLHGNDILIPAGEAIVLWVMNAVNGALTQDDFNQNFGTQLTEDINLFRVSGGGGMSNSAARTLKIVHISGEEVIEASYQNDDQTKPDMGIFYAHPSWDSKDMIMIDGTGTVRATPGQVDSSQTVKPEPPVGPEPPAETFVLNHEAIPSVSRNEDLVFSASISSHQQGGAVPERVNVSLLYRTASQSRFTVAPMNLQDGKYTTTLSADILTESELEYRIVAKSDNHTEQSDHHTIVVTGIPPLDLQQIPPLLVTELVVNSKNVGSSDGYEFIEIYNNTDREQSFENYKLYYRYTDTGPEGDVVWAPDVQDLVIPPQETVVFWIINAANQDSTAADFNAHYGTSLQHNVNLFRVNSAGMANGSRRAIVLKMNTGREVSSAYYDPTLKYEQDESSTETKEDTALLYKYPLDGTSRMIKISAGTVFPTPGAHDPAQVPAQPVHIEDDLNPPTIEDRTNVTEIDQGQGFSIRAWAEDDKQVTSVTLHIRSDKQAAYTSFRLLEDYGDKHYYYEVSPADLIGKSYLEYYFTVSDGYNKPISSSPYQVQITGGEDRSELRLNVHNEQVISGSFILKGTAEQGSPDTVKLSVNNNEITAGLFNALERDAYFAFDAKNVNYYFKNAITMGPEHLKDETILYTFMDPIPSYKTLTFPIEAGRLTEGNDNVIYIRPGSKSGPFDDRIEENKDDFEIRNIRLILANGTVLRDPAFADVEQEIKMGDAAGKYEVLGASFHIPADQFISRAYLWDTTKVPDGVYQVAAETGTYSKSAYVTVDNTAPVIQTGLQEGMLYRGAFSIEAQVTDQYAGVKQVTALLDGEEIQLPYATSSSKLGGGEHELVITALDHADNKAEYSVTFQVPNENPLQPELISPSNGQSLTGTSAELKVNVQDESGDPMKVSFYRGFLHDGTRMQSFNGYQSASVTEPPKQLAPAGEQSLSAADYAAIQYKDGQYLTTDSEEQFPYQRYEVKLDASVQPDDVVDIVWEGKSLPDRKVSLYAWNTAAARWDMLDTVIAGLEDFELNSSVRAGDYNAGGSITVLIQDEIAESWSAPDSSSPVTQDPYDFSFIWMSDTQYYSESYPYIYRSIVQWMAEKKDDLKLKYVIHTGDLVDKAEQEYQWEEADRNMKVLEAAQIPYGVLAGNHDVGHQTGDYAQYKKYFGASRFKDSPVYGGSYDDNMGHYDLVSSNGNDFIIVYMGWGLKEKEIEWMNKVVAQYPERKAILALHEYLLVSGNRAPIADEIFEKVVKPNPNVIATLSGHYHDAELNTEELDDNGDSIPDRKVYQMLADYQGAPEGGLGYIRLMQFDMTNNKLHMKTYSPYLDDYNMYDGIPGKDEFSLDLDLQPRLKRVATDYIGVKVYTNQLIGQTMNVASGDTTAMQWNGLKANEYYQWYVKVEDDFSGAAWSDVWGFALGNPVVSPPTGGGSVEPGTPAAPPAIPQPPVVAVPADGVVEIQGNASGQYQVNENAVKQAAAAAAAAGLKQLRLKLQPAIDPTSSVLPQVQLDVAAMSGAAQSKLSLMVESSDSKITLPAAALDQLSSGGSTSIILKFGAQAVQAGPSLQRDMTSLGMRFDIAVTENDGSASTAVEGFAAPIQVEWKLTKDQLNRLDADYAGIYENVNGQLRYVGGTFAGDMVSFQSERPGQYELLEHRKQFSDMSGSWAEEYVQKLAAKHIIKGIDHERYAPSVSVTRADFAVLAMRSLGEEGTDSPAVLFNDVAEGAYYASEVSKAAALGLIQGYEGSFRPKDSITREEAAVLLQRMLRQLGIPAAGSSSAAAFADADQISPWALRAVTELQELGILNGKGQGVFAPDAPVTRAELAKMIYEVRNQHN
ncbi:metallophosphoesterase [Paenibacillus algicola]|uniref:Metallophosphoesterase n=1 Tax=Paenibacillus algicola TaxID=2565926 RepID=A0A4P8XLK4_9BACL|nr:S-layer homology domain-containing protein [Paenibacillus algicola]QCT03368.1 metallophosphoesterase [Paenibacillus algicola]